MKQLIRQILKEEVSEGLKRVIKKRLSKELSDAEIIYDDRNESIWLIDRENKYWYLELKKNGDLWWRYQFFTEFFQFFSIEQSEFEPIIAEWVEDLLKRKVVSTWMVLIPRKRMVEDLLKRNK